MTAVKIQDYMERMQMKSDITMNGYMCIELGNIFNNFVKKNCSQKFQWKHIQ